MAKYNDVIPSDSTDQKNNKWFLVNESNAGELNQITDHKDKDEQSKAFAVSEETVKKQTSHFQADSYMYIDV